MRETWRVVVGMALACSVLAGCESAASKSPVKAATQIAPVGVERRIVQESNRRVLQLTNGFTIILQQNRTAAVVAARVYIKAGSLTEGQYMGAGISHVVEHLVAGETSGKRGEAENALLLQSIGNDSNAYTDYDHTCYFITTTAEKWPIALDLLTDWTTQANFTRGEFAHEYEVVQRELEMDEAQPDFAFYMQAAANRYLEHPARHPIIGYKPAFQKIKYEDVQAYYRQMYVPDNMIISIAGDINLNDAEKKIIAALSGVERKTVPAISLPREPEVVAPRQSITHADVKQARVMWGFPTTSIYSDDLYATDVLANIMGGGESSLLVRKLRDELGLVVEIGCMNDTPRFAEGTFGITAVLDEKNIPAAKKALLEVIQNVIDRGVESDAVKRARAQTAAQMIYGNQTAEQQASRNALDYLGAGNIDFTETYTRRIGQVTPEQVQAAAVKYLKPERLITTTMLPNRLEKPATQPAVAATEPTPPPSTEPATRPNRRGSRATADAGSATRRTILKNGMTLLITRNPAAPVATFQLYVQGGLLAENDANNGVGNAMMQLMTRGTASRNHQELADFLDSSGTTLSAESGNNSFALSVQCLKDRQQEAFDLFSDVALHPRFDTEEFQSLRPQLLAAIEQSTEDWFGEAYKYLRNDYYVDSPYKRMPVGAQEVVARLTVDDIRNHYQKYFLNPTKTVLAISGDIDEAAAARWAARFDSIPVSTVTLADKSIPAQPQTLHHETAKQSATIMFAFPPGAKISSPDHDALVLLQTYLGGYSSQGGSVLFETLRHQGLVYTVQASAIAGPAGGTFLIVALGEPQNTDRIVANINQIIADTRAGRFDEKTLNAAKDQAIMGKQLEHQTIGEKSAAQALDEVLGLGYDYDRRFADSLRKLTKEDIVRAANKYLAAPVVVITAPAMK